ncbi:cobalamin B12-binding domain-containing protein [Agrobacterium rosae]|nr:cobalamin-dependent protein [Agrobacterium rosae]
MSADLEKTRLDISRSAIFSLRTDSSLRVVLTTISSDSHTWNLVFLQLYLEEQGHEVVNLGPCVPDEIIIAECRRTRADMLIVSSVNGHGGSEGVRLVKLLRATSDLADLPAVIGGKLGIRGCGNAAHTTSLLDAGFNAVFEAQSGPDDLGRFIESQSPRSRLHRLSILDGERLHS